MNRLILAITIFGCILQSDLVFSQHAITLAEAYSLARDNDTRVQIAGFQRDAVVAREDQATALFFPQVRLFSQYSKNEVEYENSLVEDRRYDGRRYGASVSQRLFDWGALSQRRAAMARTKSAELTLSDESQLLAVRVVDAYLTVLASIAKSQVLTDEFAALEQQASQGFALAQRQLLSQTSALEVAARRDLVKTQQIDAHNAANLASEFLFALIGVRDRSPARSGDPFVPFEVSTGLDTLIADVLANNPRALALREEQRAARSAIDQTWGSVLPKIDLVATQQYSDVGFDNTTSPPRNTSYIGLNVNWTLIEGGAARARAREAWANYYMAGERLRQQEQDLERQVRSTWLEVDASVKRLAAAQSSLQSAISSFDASSRAHQLGLGSMADMLLSQSAVTRAELNVVSATTDNIMAWVELQYITGRLEPAILSTIDERL